MRNDVNQEIIDLFSITLEPLSIRDVCDVIYVDYGQNHIEGVRVRLRKGIYGYKFKNLGKCKKRKINLYNIVVTDDILARRQAMPAVLKNRELNTGVLAEDFVFGSTPKFPPGFDFINRPVSFSTQKPRQCDPIT